MRKPFARCAPVPIPQVSVCLDVFNYADFLPRAIESVLSQTGVDFELIIADDGSTDGSFEIAQNCADPRVRLIRNALNLGMVRNRNVALAAARGRFVKPLHADDFLGERHALAKLAAKLESNPAIILAASAITFVTDHGARIGEWSCFNTEHALAGTGVITRCLGEQRNLVGGPSAVIFRREAAERGFDESFFHMADLEMWFHLLERGGFAFVAEPLCAYRRHARQQTERDRATLSQADDYDALLARYLDQPYVALSSWRKRHLRRAAQLEREKRCRELGLPAAKIPFLARAVHSLAKLALRQQRRWATRDRREQQTKVTRPFGVNVAGFFASEFGVGESSRAICRAVELSGLPCAFLNVRNKVHRNANRTVRHLSARNPFAVNLMTFSMDYARRFYRDRGRRFFSGRYNIALWYWELEKLSPRWHSCFDYYDEIWVTTEFCRKAVEEVSPLPVTKITPPLLIPDYKPDRTSFALHDSSFVFMFSFDHLSLIERKNPQAVIGAFSRAFNEQEDAVLLIKSINANRDPAGRAFLHQMALGKKVVFFEEHMRDSQVASLFASIDCYVSLHRSEGLGLGMAQAMSLGKPVIATNYSGNLEFMNASNSLLVSCKLVEIEKTCGPYERGYVWAEPDVDHAAGLMRQTYEDRDAAAAIGQRAAKDIEESMSVQKTAQEIEARISVVLRDSYRGE